MLVPPADIDDALLRIRPYLPPTPLIRSWHYSAQTGANVYLKLEMLQPTRSFKARGAFNALLTLPTADRARGVVTASGGNHGLGVTLAAQTVGVPAEIVLPENTPANKQAAIRALGGTVTLYGDVWDTANEYAVRLARDTRRAYIHPFDNPFVMAGQATIFRELTAQLPRVDTVIVSIGGGGLISGLISAAQDSSPDTQIFGVETIGADSMAQSVTAGKIVTLPRIESIAESLGAKQTAPRQFDIVRTYAAGLFSISDKNAVAALFDLLEHEKLLVEPAAACNLAALSQIPLKQDANVVVIICGANITFKQALRYRKQFGLARRRAKEG